MSIELRCPWLLVTVTKCQGRVEEDGTNLNYSAQFLEVFLNFDQMAMRYVSN
jgi:hypothetical protein